MNLDKEKGNQDNFELNQEQIIADAAKNIVEQQGQLFPDTNPKGENANRPVLSSPVNTIPTEQSQQIISEFEQPATQQSLNSVVVNNVDSSQPLSQQSNIPKKSFLSKLPSTRKNFFFALAGLLLFAGLLVGLVITTNAMFNRPQTVVAKSILNSAKADYFNAVKTNINVTNDDGTSISFYAIGGQKDSVSRADFNLRYAVFNIDGSFLYDNKQESAYFKVNGLSDLAKALGAPVNTEQNFDSWIKMNKDDISGASNAVGAGKQESQVNPMLCIESMSKFIQTDEFRSKISEAYKNNQFANVQKVGNETVDNQKTGKYSVAVDSNSFDLFMTDLSNNALKPKLSAVDPSCDVSSDETVSPETSGDVQIKNVFVWVNSKKQLLQIAGEIESGSTKATIQLNMVNDNKLDYAVPANSVNSLQQLLGV